MAGYLIKIDRPFNGYCLYFGRFDVWTTRFFRASASFIVINKYGIPISTHINSISLHYLVHFFFWFSPTSLKFYICAIDNNFNVHDHLPWLQRPTYLFNIHWKHFRFSTFNIAIGHKIISMHICCRIFSFSSNVCIFGTKPTNHAWKLNHDTHRRNRFDLPLAPPLSLSMKIVQCPPNFTIIVTFIWSFWHCAELLTNSTKWAWFWMWWSSKTLFQLRAHSQRRMCIDLNGV